MADEHEPTTDLTHVDTADLMVELQNRHPLGFVIICEGEEGEGRYKRRLYNGPFSTILGMLDRAHAHILGLAEDEEDDSDE
jgi:hypothetical protein